MSVEEVEASQAETVGDVGDEDSILDGWPVLLEVEMKTQRRKNWMAQNLYGLLSSPRFKSKFKK